SRLEIAKQEKDDREIAAVDWEAQKRNNQIESEKSGFEAADYKLQIIPKAENDTYVDTLPVSDDVKEHLKKVHNERFDLLANAEAFIAENQGGEKANEIFETLNAYKKKPNESALTYLKIIVAAVMNPVVEPEEPIAPVDSEIVPKTLPLEFSIKFEEFHTGSGTFGTAKLTQSDNGLSYDLIDNKGKKTQVWSAKIREMLASGEWKIIEPHYSEIILNDLVANYGWNKAVGSLISKNVGGAPTGGAMNPDGNLVVNAKFDEAGRYLTLQSGFDDVLDIDCRGDSAEKAKEFNDAVTDWAIKNAVNPASLNVSKSIEPTGDENAPIETTSESDDEIKLLISRVPKNAPILKLEHKATGTIKEMREQAKEYARTNFVGSKIHNDELNADIGISMGGVKHTLSGNSGEDLVNSVFITPDILKKGVYIGNEPERKGNKSVLRHHYLAAKIEINGMIHDVVADVREMADGHFYYDHSFERNNASESLPSSNTEQSPASKPEGLSETIPQPAENTIAPDEQLFNNQIAAFQSTTGKINAAIAEVNYDAIIDIKTSTQEFFKLRHTDDKDYFSRDLKRAQDDFFKAEIDYPYDKVRATAEYKEWLNAGELLSQVGDKIQDFGKEKLIELGKKSLKTLSPDASIEEKAAAVYASYGIDTTNPSLIGAINNKSVNYLREILGVLDNKASREVFRLATGVKLVGTKKETLSQIDAFCGITPEKRAEIQAEKDNQRAEKEKQSNLDWAWNVLKQNINADGTVQLMSDYIVKKYADGFTEIVGFQSGAVSKSYIAKKDDNSANFGFKKFKPFGEFLKLAKAFGGLEKALIALGEIEQAPQIEEPTEINLTGKELGDFEDTEEGKKALRKAAISLYEKDYTGKGVLNVALDKIVEFNNTGRNHIEYHSSDPRKLKLVSALKQIVAHGIPTPASPMQPHAKAAKRGVIKTHILKTPVKLEGETIKARFLIHEMKNGHFFYDHSVDKGEVAAMMGRNTEALDSTDAVNLNLSALLSLEPSNEHHRPDSTVIQDDENINDDFEIDENDLGKVFEVDKFEDSEFTLDAVSGGGMVFNLFIEGEEPEIVEPAPEYVVWGIREGEVYEEPLNTEAKNLEEAKRIEQYIKSKGVKSTHIQVLDMNAPPDFTGALNQLKNAAKNPDREIAAVTNPVVEPSNINKPTEIEPEKLSGIGVAKITSIGEENIYFEKDGVAYYSKVMNTDKYQVGEHDFSNGDSFAVEPESVEPDGIENQQEIKTEFESLQYKLAVDIEAKVNNTIKENYGDGNYNAGWRAIFGGYVPSTSMIAKTDLCNFAGANKAMEILSEKYPSQEQQKFVFNLYAEFGTKQLDAKYGRNDWYQTIQKIIDESAKKLSAALTNAKEPQGIDPVALENINAANLSDAIKKKATAYLNANPSSHTIEGISPKSLKAIMESIKTALFAEIQALSPLFKNLDNAMTLSIPVAGSYYPSSIDIVVDPDYRFSFRQDGEKIYDSTSTIEELRQWGFALPFDLDVKAFVANVIKPVVDEFLGKVKEGVQGEPTPEIETESNEADLEVQPAENATADIDAEIAELETLIGAGDIFDEKIDALIEKIDGLGLMTQFKPKLLQLDRDNSNANAKGI
ncbi:MAG: hypothetical protein WCL34_10205, partial [Methylococcaceae bacterium]